MSDAEFIPIDEAARDGTRQLVSRGSTLAAAQWTGDMWSYPYGPGPLEGSCPVQLDFEPTHYRPKISGSDA